MHKAIRTSVGKIIRFPGFAAYAQNPRKQSPERSAAGRPLPISLKSQIARRQKLQADTIGICAVYCVDLVRNRWHARAMAKHAALQPRWLPFESALVRLVRLREPPFSLLPSSAGFALEGGEW